MIRFFIALWFGLFMGWKKGEIMMNVKNAIQAHVDNEHLLVG
jgi:hypothetical protein